MSRTLATDERAMLVTVGLIVATERLGYPPQRRGWRKFLPWEYQGQMRYPDRTDEPTAACHLQRDDDQPALCGFPWEALIEVPGQPRWEDLDTWLRCDRCDALQGTAG